jgi:hypothetical protein
MDDPRKRKVTYHLRGLMPDHEAANLLRASNDARIASRSGPSAAAATHEGASPTNPEFLRIEADSAQAVAGQPHSVGGNQ